MAAENFKVKKGLEVGTGITANSDGVNVTGVITATQFKGDGSGLTGVVGSGSGVVIKDEGSAVGTAGTINFVGTGIAAAISEGTATVTVNAGGLDNVVEDTTPQLGGNLDLNSKFVTGSGGINVTGVVTATNAQVNSNITLGGDIIHSGDDTKIRFPANDTILFETAGSERLRIGTSGITTFNANVDVKAELTANKLILDDDGSSSPTLTIAGDDENVFGMVLVNDTYKSSPAAGFKHTQLNNGEIQVLLRANNSATRLPYKIQQGNAPTGLWDSFTIDADGAVKLGFGGNQKLITTINGIEVPDLNVTGVGTVGRLDTSGVTLGTNNNTFAAKFIDSAVINVGTGNDLQISHANDVSLIRDTRAGAGATLAIGADKLFLRNKDGNENYLEATDNGSVKLYHDFLPKFETDQAGVKITGVCTATSFSGDGSGLTGITASGSGVLIKHDGSNVGTAGTINFSTNLDVTPISAGIVTVTASGGSGITINNNGTSKVITGSGTANTLNANVNLTFDGTTLDVKTGTGVVNTGSVVVGSAVTINSTGINATGIAITAYNLRADNALVVGSGGIDGTSRPMITGGGGLDMNYFAGGNAYSQHNFKLLQGGSTIERFRISQHGVDVSGIATATTFSGSGASLTALNASELDSGTIPNARFPATLPATSGANLTALNASQISSGTLPIARIADEAITFAKMQHVGTGVLIGRNDSGSGDIETLTASEVRTLLNVADGATAGITTAPSNIVATWDVVNNGASSYRFTGPGQSPTADNPDIYLVRGNTYRFALSASGHPFQIRVSSGGSAYNSGVTNNGAQTGNVEFYVQNDAPASLVYQCTSHGGMVGNIYITGHQLTNGADNRVVTATSAYGMTGESNLTFDGTHLVVSPTSASNTIRTKIRASSANDDGRLGIYYGNTEIAALFGKWSGSAFSTGLNIPYEPFVVTGASGAERLRIDTSGRVGINESSPQSLLDIHDSASANDTPEIRIDSFRPIIRFADRSSSHADSEICGDDGIKFRISAESDNDTALTERLRITSTGAVLLGTTTASNSELFRIHTSDSGKAIIKLTNSTTGTGTGDGFEFGMNANEEIEFVNKENTDMFFATSNTERLRIRGSDGNVMIKTDVQFDTDGSGGIFGKIVRSAAAYTANDNIDIAITSGNYIFSVRSAGVYHYNAIFMVTYYDSADKGSSEMVQGDYQTTVTHSVIHNGSNNGTFRLSFNRAFSTLNIRQLKLS